MASELRYRAPEGAGSRPQDVDSGTRDSMGIEDLARIITTAQAAGRRVTIVVIEGGGGPSEMHVADEDAADRSLDVDRGEAYVPEGDPARWSPLERLQAVIAQEGEGWRKEAEWALDVCSNADFPARELERACRAGAIAWTRKGDGLDAGARLIHASALREYLLVRENVLQGKATAPGWWPEVVKRRHRRAA